MAIYAVVNVRLCFRLMVYLCVKRVSFFWYLVCACVDLGTKKKVVRSVARVRCRLT